MHANLRNSHGRKIPRILGHEGNIRGFGRTTFAQEQGLRHAALEGAKPELGGLVVVNGKINTAIAEVANAVEQNNRSLVAPFRKHVLGHFLPIPIDNGIFCGHCFSGCPFAANSRAQY